MSDDAGNGEAVESPAKSENSQNVDLPIMAITASDDEGIFLSAIRAGTSGYLVKGPKDDRLPQDVGCQRVLDVCSSAAASGQNRCSGKTS